MTPARGASLCASGGIGKTAWVLPGSTFLPLASTTGKSSGVRGSDPEFVTRRPVAEDHRAEKPEHGIDAAVMQETEAAYLLFLPLGSGSIRQWEYKQAARARPGAIPAERNGGR